MAGRLYVVATPIGHLSDLSQRAAQTLSGVDVVAAEDTRVTRVLLRHIGSKAKLTSSHAHNARASIATILGHLSAGRSVALVSDAGTPAISDPGNAVVAAACEAGIEVVPIPGPSAVTALLSAAGLSDGPFLFEGFLPARPKARDERLAAATAAAAAAGAVLVLYEAPHRVAGTLEAIAAGVGPGRRLAIGRELTKAFEEIWRGPAGDAPAWLAAKPERTRGEFVIAVDRPADDGTAATPAEEAVAIETGRLLACLLQELPLSRAVKLAQQLTGAPHRELYAKALQAKAQADGA
jgi:16S rRNA (cytidine1402-2'-O)-methyltransferase